LNLYPKSHDDNKIKERKNKGQKRTVFIVWEPHSPRAEGLSQFLGANLYILRDKIQKRFHAPLQYIKLFTRTLNILRKEKPEIIFCQLPPIFCAISAMVYGFFSHKKCRIVLDMHTGAFHKPWSYFKFLNKWVMKRASFIIVTNTELLEDLPAEYLGRSIVLEDRIPEIQSIKQGRNVSRIDNSKTEVHRSEITLELANQIKEPRFKIAVIWSFSPDEPLEEVLAAAASKPEIIFYITHDVSRANKQILNKKTDNVILTGFLEYNEYLTLLAEVNAIMVLTTRDKTMLCGAYEAVALEKPLIISNFKPLKRYFHKGAFYVDNSANEIQKAIEYVTHTTEEMTKEMSYLRQEKTNEWKKKFIDFRSQLYGSSVI
jgi:hypothetical protein